MLLLSYEIVNASLCSIVLCLLILIVVSSINCCLYPGLGFRDDGNSLSINLFQVNETLAYSSPFKYLCAPLRLIH